MENINELNELNELIRECTGDIIMAICFLSNTCLASSIINNYFINNDDDDNYIFYNIINVVIGLSLAYPYYILYTKYINFHLKNI
jgi:hypothetical protein